MKERDIKKEREGLLEGKIWRARMKEEELG